MYTLGIHFAISGFKILALILFIVLFQVLTIRQYGTCCDNLNAFNIIKYIKPQFLISLDAFSIYSCVSK